MATLSPAPPAVADDAPELDPHIARLMASKLIARGDTSAGVREYAATRSEYSYMWLAVAAEMDALAASVPAQPSAPALEAVPS
jgi:hypothetical protein